MIEVIQYRPMTPQTNILINLEYGQLLHHIVYNSHSSFSLYVTIDSTLCTEVVKLRSLTS